MPLRNPTPKQLRTVKMKNPLKALNEVFGAAFRGASKNRVFADILSRLLLAFAMLLTGCATSRESATSPFFPNGAVAGPNGEYGDEIRKT